MLTKLISLMQVPYSIMIALYSTYILYNGSMDDLQLFYIMLFLFYLIKYMTLPFLSFRFIFWFFFTLLFVMTPSLNYLFEWELYLSFPKETQIIYSFLLGYSTMLFTLFFDGINLKNRNKEINKIYIYNSKKLRRINNYFYIMSSILFLILFMLLPKKVLLMTRGDLLDIDGKLKILRLIISYIAYLFPIFTFYEMILLKNSKRWTRVIFTIKILIFQILIFLIFRVRGYLVAEILSLLVTYYNYDKLYLDKSTKRLSKKQSNKKVKIIILGLVGFISISYIKVLRGYLGNQNKIELDKILTIDFFKNTLSKGDLIYSEMIMKIIEVRHVL